LLSIFDKYIFAKIREKMFLTSVPNVLLTKYYSGYQIEKNAMGGAGSTYGERIRVYRGLVGKPEGKKKRGRPRRRLEDDTRWIFR
jgi:hypothetical protein